MKLALIKGPMNRTATILGFLSDLLALSVIVRSVAQPSHLVCHCEECSDVTIS